MSEVARVKEENTSTTWVNKSYCLFLVGYLYPDRDRELTDCDSFEKLKDAVRGFEYEQML